MKKQCSYSAKALSMILAILLVLNVFAPAVSAAGSEADTPAQVDSVHSVPFSQVTVQDDFWTAKQKQFICEVIPTAIANISKSTGGMPNGRYAQF